MNAGWFESEKTCRLTSAQLSTQSLRQTPVLASPLSTSRRRGSNSRLRRGAPSLFAFIPKSVSREDSLTLPHGNSSRRRRRRRKGRTD